MLYIDVDILVTRNLNVFLRDLHEYVGRRMPLSLRGDGMRRPGSLRSLHMENRTVVNIDGRTIPQVDFGAFLDAKGHYVGFCSGCEKW